MSRFHLHLNADQLDTFINDVKDVINRYADSPKPDSPGYGGMFVLHRLADQPNARRTGRHA